MAVAACAAICLLGTVKAAIGFLGFAWSGVVASSMAAVWQSSIANVAGASVFALLQSIGAAGFAWSTYMIAGCVGAIMAFIGMEW